MRDVIYHNKFKRDMERGKTAGREFFDELMDVIAMLQADTPLPVKCHDHPLRGNWAPARECHIRPDLLLVYSKPPGELRLLRLASHSELF